MSSSKVCSECGLPLPQDWDPVEERETEPVCPKCAAKHIKSKSQRRRVMEILLDMYEDEPVEENPAKRSGKQSGPKPRGAKDDP